MGQKSYLSKKESPKKAEVRGCKQQKAHWTLISAVAKPAATQAGPAAHHTDSKAFTLNRSAEDEGSSQSLKPK